MLVLDQTITIWRKAGNTGFGETFATGATASGRYVQRTGIAKDQRGNEVTTTHRAYTEAAIAEGDYVYLGSYGGDLSTPPDDAYQVIKRHDNPLTDLVYVEL